MLNIPKTEEKILKLWKDKDVFKKSLEKDSPQGDFVFYDGPPFATGTPHYGHLVANLMKDIVPRYWTMKGYHVERKWGWDCHGLPIENIVEEELKLKNKKEIEEIGIEKFNETCRSKVLLYAEEWRKVVDRLGRWVDMDNDYKTMDKDYMESIWWVFKELWDKDLIYESYKSMHICPRCETTLSQSEVSQGYQDVEDVSVITKFELVDEPGTYILAWTTTPWTLPGNVALAMGEKVEYALVESGAEKFILAKQNLDTLFNGRKYKIIDKVKAKDLEGKKYKPLVPYFEDKKLANKENLYTIQLADFVSVEDGTGVVHIAPAFGEDDMNLGNQKKLPFIQHVQMDGRFTKDVKDFAGQEVKAKDDRQATDKKVITYLEKKNLVFKVEPFTHSYPHCWRCESPLLNYATSSWFVEVTKIKDKLLKTAKDINWVPAHIKQGRFGKWLEGARDWSISRQRFWGSVIPIWQCVGNAAGTENKKTKKQKNTLKGNDCGNKVVVGSVDELEKLSGQKVKDLHKHFVDKIEFKCEKCGSVMRRIPDVLDCWFESGSMPYAQMHCPFANQEKFEKNFPAEFIAEGVDQTTTWFYYLHVLSSAVKKSEAFKNVIVNGIVLAEDGKKMSKRLQNYPDPMEIMDKYGADAVRYYLCASQVMKADNLCFSEKDLAEQTRFFNTLLNVVAFYKMFSDTNVFANKANDFANIKNILDKWIIAKLEVLKKKVTQKMDSYNLHAIREIPEFINDLSQWYVRRSRDRFKGDNEKDKNQAIYTLGKVLFDLTRLMAPFTPFITEYIYQELGKECGSLKESVHLEDWPEFDKKAIDQKVLDYMDMTRKVVEMALAERAEAGVKVRQPLKQLIVNNQQLTKEYLDLIKDEVNVKEVVCKKGDGDLVTELSHEISHELKQEGYLRELVRAINGMRKKAGLTLQDKIKIEYNTQDAELKDVFDKFKNELLKQTIAGEIAEGGGKMEKVKVNGVDIELKITKI